MSADEEGLTRHDRRTRRCPMLGHEIHFGYCRSPASPTPCRNVVGCWKDAFNVEGFLRDHFSLEDIAKIHAPRKDKAATLVELIQRARRTADGS